MVVTSRTQHFLSEQQVKQALYAQIETVSARRLVELRSFEPDQVRSFLVNYYQSALPPDNKNPKRQREGDTRTMSWTRCKTSSALPSSVPGGPTRRAGCTSKGRATSAAVARGPPRDVRSEYCASRAWIRGVGHLVMTQLVGNIRLDALPRDMADAAERVVPVKRFGQELPNQALQAALDALHHQQRRNVRQGTDRELADGQHQPRLCHHAARQRGAVFRTSSEVPNARPKIPPHRSAAGWYPAQMPFNQDKSRRMSVSGDSVSCRSNP